jgi:hypothetical protein
VSHDDTVIPTLLKGPGEKKKNLYEGEDFGPDAFPEGKSTLGEDIAPENMKYAEPLMPIFGEEMVRKMYSKSWPTRDEGLKQCEDFLKENLNSGNSQKLIIF